MRKPNLDKIISDNLDKSKFQSKVNPNLPKDGWLDAYQSGGIYLSDRAKATQFGQYKRGGGYFPPYHSYAPPRMEDGGPGPGYFKNYINQMAQDYKNWYSVPRGTDDGFDSYYHHLRNQAPMETTTGPAWKVKNTKYPNDEGNYLFGETLPKDVQAKVDKGRFTAEFIPNYTSTSRDESMDGYYSDLTKYLMSKKAYGGDISIPDLNADKWLMKYQTAGQVIPGVTDFKMPRLSNESTSLGTKIDEAAIRQAQIDKARERQGVITKAEPKRSDASKAWAIATHPMTALSYKAKGQDIPENFERGETNPYEHALNIVNPAGYVDMAASIPGNIKRGEYLEAGINTASLLPMLAELRGLAPEIRSAVNASKESGLLSNTYKLNPWAFKPNPEAYYRMLGKEGYDDALRSGMIRPKQYNDLMSLTSEGSFDFTPKKGQLFDEVYFDKGNLAEHYGGPYAVEYSSKTPLQEVSGYPKGYYVSNKNIPINNEGVKFLKQDWLKGYKEVPKPRFISSEPIITRGPINYWEMESFKQKNPYFSHDAYVNRGMGYTANVPEEMLQFKEWSIPEPLPKTPEEKAFSSRIKDRNTRVVEDFFKNKNLKSEQKKEGGVIKKDDRGQWAHPGEITEIQGNTMATHGYGDIPLYVVPDVGEPRVVNANTGTHTFPGATKFIEYPMMQKRGGIEGYINKSLGNPMGKAERKAEQVGEKWYNPKTKKWESEQVDNFRHPMAGRYTAEAIAGKFPSWMQYTGIPTMAGFIGSNALGVGHEVMNPNRNPNYTLWDTVREGGEDAFNNMIGAGVGSLPLISGKQKTKILKYLSDNNLLPDGYGKGNMYFKEQGGLVKYQSLGEVTGKNCRGKCWKPFLKDESNGSGGTGYVSNAPVTVQGLIASGREIANKKRIAQRTKELQEGFPGLSEDDVAMAMGDSARVAAKLWNFQNMDKNIAKYNQLKGTSINEAHQHLPYSDYFYKFYRPQININPAGIAAPLTVSEILSLYSSPEQYRQTVQSNYKQEYGGPLKKFHQGKMTGPGIFQSGGDISIPKLPNIKNVLIQLSYMGYGGTK